MAQVNNKIISKIKSDFFLVLSANIFSYLINFCGSIVYVHLLGKIDFGLYSFAFGIISLFLLVNGFGSASGVLQYVSRAKTDLERSAYLQFAFRSGMLFNALIAIIIILYALIMPLPMPAAKPILLGMALFPVGRFYIDVFQAYLRAAQRNILQARFLMINNTILLSVNLIGIVFFKLYGLIYFTYIGYALMFIISRYYLHMPSVFSRITYQLNKRNFLSYSFFTTLANAFSGLLFVLDTIIISYIVKDPILLATYRVATIIPFAINFIPNLAVNFYYPEFVKNAHDPVIIKQLARRISLRMLCFSLPVSLILIVLAKPIILFIFGTQYSASILPFQIISFGYWIIASIRTVNGNVLAALGHAKLSFYLTSIILIANVLITYLLVVRYSINGAAMAIVIMYMFSSLVGYLSLKLVLYGMQK